MQLEGARYYGRPDPSLMTIIVRSPHAGWLSPASEQHTAPLALVALGNTMQAMLARTTAAVLRSNGAAPGAAVASTRAAAALRPQPLSAENIVQQQRGLAVERMVYGMKVTDEMKVSEPVRRVLSIDNSDM